MKTDLKVAWPCPWFGDYRVPVFADLNDMLGGNLKLFYGPIHGLPHLSRF